MQETAALLEAVAAGPGICRLCGVQAVKKIQLVLQGRSPKASLICHGTLGL